MADVFHETHESFVDEPVEKDKVSKKKRTVEEIYQKKSPLEHILLRPDTYVGSIEKHTTQMWAYSEEEQKMVQRDLTYVPALYKIFDEILVNAADNKIRDKNMNCIKIDIKPGENMVRVWNNGQGIPVEYHKVENMYVPSLIFGHLLTSSNYDDSERKVTGGRNGYGAKLCNIFSKKFIVETSSRATRKSFKQTWIDNMTKTNDPSISEAAEADFTCITFFPDLKRFGMKDFEKDIEDLYKRRAFDIAASCPGVRVFLNGKRLQVASFKEYVELFLKDNDENDQSVKLVHERVNDRWEVVVAPSSNGFRQMSFVNSIATTQGGKHVDYVTDQICNKLVEHVKKKSNKTGVNIRGKDLKNYIQIYINCLIENPAFASQTKELLVLEPKKFGSTCELSEKFITGASKCGVVDLMMSWVRFKAMEKMDKQCHKSKHSKLKGIPKLDDANDAGTKNSANCTLILTEGDSAKSLAVAGLGVIGRDNYGIFPLRGKLLNVREAPTKQLTENAEINNLIKIVGLQYQKKYENFEDLKSLRYGKVMIMTDQDQDGSHIKGLVINFIHTNWPNLLKHSFLEEFITPIVKVFKNKQEMSFYSLPEFQEWLNTTPNSHTWRVKYYKGLGTSSSKEAKEYFADLQRHRIKFRYQGNDDDNSILLAFSKNKIDDRKDWLTKWMEERKERAVQGLPEIHLYGKDTRAITYRDFVHRELVLFSNMDNERSIPSLMDGLKPGQRKVLFTCFKRNLIKEIKVAQLAGSVSEISAYHHGEASLMSTIIGLAQDFVGSNNLNLLMPHGQFGTRLNGGKDAASPRYIFTSLNPITRLVFSPQDDPLLKYNIDDNQRIEPEWYCPIIPMVLINGAEGIGTGWSTKILNYDLLDVVDCLKKMIADQEPPLLKPNFRGFNGLIEEFSNNRYAIFGEIAAIDETTIEITELPVRTWTQKYKEDVLEPMLQSTDKTPASITDYKEYHTDKTVRFIVKLTPEKMREAESQGLHKFFKILTTLTTNSMVLFDSLGVLRRYDSVMEILKEFYIVRLQYYEKRKNYLDGMLTAEASKLENQARFVLEKIEGKIKIENRAKKELIKILKEAGYSSDPVRKWKESLDKEGYQRERSEVNEALVASGEQVIDDYNEESDDSEVLDYNYILNMPLWSLTLERKNDLLAQRDKKSTELINLRKKTPKNLYSDDLLALEACYKKQLVESEKELSEAHEKAKKKLDKSGGRGGKLSKVAIDTRPNPDAIRVIPKVDSDMIKKFSDVKVKALKKTIAKREKNDNADLLEDNEDDPFYDKPRKTLLQRLFADNDAFKEIMKNGDKNPAPKARRKTEPATKKKEPIMLTDEDEDPELSAKKVRTLAPRAATKINFFESENGSEASSEGFTPKKKSPRKKSELKTKKKVTVSDGDKSFNDSINENISPPKKAEKKQAPKREPAAKKAKVVSTNTSDVFDIHQSDYSDDDFSSKRTKKQTTQKTNKPQGLKKSLQQPNGSKPKNVTVPKKKKPTFSESEDEISFDIDDSNGSDFKPERKRTKRLLKKPTYVVSESDEEDRSKKPIKSAKVFSDSDDEFMPSD